MGKFGAVGAGKMIDWEKWPHFEDMRLMVSERDYRELMPFMRTAMEKHFISSCPVPLENMYQKWFDYKNGDPEFVVDDSASPDRKHFSRRGFYWPGED